MKPSSQLGSLCLAVAGLAALTPSVKAKPASDIASIDARRAIVAKAEQLAAPPKLAPVPTEWPQPFNPPGFGRPATAARDNASPGGRENATNAQPVQLTDRDTLAIVAAKIPTTGSIVLGGKPLLISGTNRIEIGSRFTVVYNGQEYELELVAITSTTFTVRYKGEEYTRPILIKQGK